MHSIANFLLFWIKDERLMILRDSDLSPVLPRHCPAALFPQRIEVPAFRLRLRAVLPFGWRRGQVSVLLTYCF